MLFDVLIWFGGRLYVKIIIVHGVQTLHVVLIHTCNMGKMHWHHALHMHCHIASGRVWVQGKVYSPALVNGS